MLPTKTSYTLAFLFFIFDSVLSYFAVTRMGAREANLVIAPYVEKYPLLYFVIIPLLMVGLVLLTKTVRKHLPKIEKVFLTSFVIYWGIANSGPNFAYMVGLRHTLFNNWGAMSLIGIFTATIYLLRHNT